LERAGPGCTVSHLALWGPPHPPCRSASTGHEHMRKVGTVAQSATSGDCVTVTRPCGIDVVPSGYLCSSFTTYQGSRYLCASLSMVFASSLTVAPSTCRDSGPCLNSNLPSGCASRVGAPIPPCVVASALRRSPSGVYEELRRLAASDRTCCRRISNRRSRRCHSYLTGYGRQNSLSKR
jgi:hypothetical protein